MPAVDRHPHLSFCHHRSRHIYQNRLCLPSGGSKCDRIGAQASVDSPKRGDLITQVPGIHKDQTNQSFPGGHERIRTSPAYMAGIPQRDATDAVYPGLLTGQLCCKGRAHLSHRPLRIHNSQAGILLDDHRNRPGLEPPFPDRPGILVEPDGAVRVVTEEIRLDKVVHDGPRVLGRTPGSFEKLVTNPAQSLRLKFRHGKPFHLSVWTTKSMYGTPGKMLCLLWY